jgi:hypothetical protein
LDERFGERFVREDLWMMARVNDTIIPNKLSLSG